MRILSMDQSSTKSGYCIFENEKYAFSGLVDKSKNKDTDARVIEMGLALCNKISEFNPDKIIIENVQQQSGVSTVILLARLQGFILGFASAHNIPVEILGPSKWRSALGYKQGAGVKRKELKQQSLDYVKRMGLSIKSEDECEAVCINQAAHKIFNFSEDDFWGK